MTITKFRVEIQAANRSCGPISGRQPGDEQQADEVNKWKTRRLLSHFKNTCTMCKLGFPKLISLLLFLFNNKKNSTELYSLGVKEKYTG